MNDDLSFKTSILAAVEKLNETIKNHEEKFQVIAELIRRHAERIQKLEDK